MTLAQLAPEFLAIPAVAREADPPDLGHEGNRLRLLGSLGHVLREFHRPAHVLWVIEDLHEGDELLLAALLYLAEDWAREHVLIVTYRPEDISGDQLKVLDHLRRLEAQTLDLHPLDTQATARLLQTMPGSRQPPEELARRFVREGRGNPLYLVESVRALRGAGHLIADESGSWRGAEGISLAEVDLPASGSVSALVLAQLHRLPADTLRAARTAAVLGREWDIR